MSNALFDSYLVYAIHPTENGVDRHLSGKYLVHDGVVHVVSDHDGLLERLDGKRLSHVQGQIEALQHAAYYQVIKKDISPEKSEDDAWEDEVFGASQRNTMKHASEMYSMFMPLMKGDLTSTFNQLRDLVGSGHLSNEHYDALRREMYSDEMVPELGNKRAYRDFLKTAPPGGAHIMLDANGLKSINDQLGHEHGDRAIVAMGGALRRAIDGTVGPGAAKAHRFGGDEFHIHVDNPQHAPVVLRRLHQELESIPHLQGTHKLSMSAGIGASPAHADQALYHAKDQAHAAVAAAGGDPTARTAAPGALYSHNLHAALGPAGTVAPSTIPTGAPMAAPPSPPLAKSESDESDVYLTFEEDLDDDLKKAGKTFNVNNNVNQSRIRAMPIEQLAGQKVKVYRNLHNGMFSVQDANGIVVAHVPELHLKDAEMRVLEGGRQRVLTEKKKNVHAFVIGTVVHPHEAPDPGAALPISYNPYAFSADERGAFTRAGSKDKITHATHARLSLHPPAPDGTVRAKMEAWAPSFTEPKAWAPKSPPPAPESFS